MNQKKKTIKAKKKNYTELNESDKKQQTKQTKKKVKFF